MASSSSSWLPPSTRSSDAGPTLVDAQPPTASADEPDTLLDAARRWEPPAPPHERHTPVVPVLADSEPTPLVLPAPRTEAGAPPASAAGALPSSPGPSCAPASSADHAPPDPPSAWLSTRRRRRPLPRGIKLALAGGVGVLLLVVLIGGRAGEPVSTTTHTASAVDDALVVNAADLRKRKEMTPEDFRAPARVRVREAAPLGEAAPAADIDVDLAARRARRADNPEDLKATGRTHKPSRRRPPEDSGTGRELVWVAPTATVDAPAADRPRRLVAAASRVPVTLPRAVRLRGGRTNVVAHVGKGESLPAGTKLLGTARLDRDGRAQIVFRTAVLPGGQQLRVEAEAEGEDGGAGVWAVLDEPVESDADDGSVAGDVADGTARRLARQTFGNGIVGGAVDDTFRARDRRVPRRPRSELVGTLPAGTALYALFLAEVVLEP